MPKPPLPPTALSEAQRTQTLERFAIIRTVLEEGITQAQVARNHNSTAQRWIKQLTQVLDATLLYIRRTKQDLQQDVEKIAGHRKRHLIPKAFC